MKCFRANKAWVDSVAQSDANALGDVVWAGRKRRSR